MTGQRASFKRIGVVAGLFGAATLLSGVVAEAYPVLAPAVAVDDPNPEPSGPIEVTVTECQVGETVEFVLGDSTDSATCSPAAGAGFVQVVTPEGGVAVGNLSAPATPGTHDGTAALLTTGVTLPFQVVVEASVAPSPTTPTTTTPSGTLPPTGGESSQMLTIAIGLLVAGGGLVVVAGFRRRRLTD